MPKMEEIMDYKIVDQDTDCFEIRKKKENSWNRDRFASCKLYFCPNYNLPFWEAQ